jgi:hypothetical protein
MKSNLATAQIFLNRMQERWAGKRGKAREGRAREAGSVNAKEKERKSKSAC